MFRVNLIWATTWQNQQNECAPSEDSYQPGHPPSLIRVLAVRSIGRTQGFFMQTAKTLIRLGGCQDWSESSLGGHSFCWVCHVAAHFNSFRVILCWFGHILIQIKTLIRLIIHSQKGLFWGKFYPRWWWRGGWKSSKRMYLLCVNMSAINPHTCPEKGHEFSAKLFIAGLQVLKLISSFTATRCY